ncbi:YfaZ family outer membrane protein [Thalassotalea sp. PLHSN55]|uniref:YfaZ family outer membrane protein n=1 Tax=Thalassotalea sp. PLHSN55 TaxID=3435888 RepID=UPI003F826E1E
MKLSKIINITIVALSSLLLATAANANSLHLSLSNNNLGLGAEVEEITPHSSADLEYFAEDHFNLYRAGIYVDAIERDKEHPHLGDMAIKVGPKAVYVKSDHYGYEGGAVALAIKMEFPLSEKLTTYMSGSFANSKMAFDNLERYEEFTLGIKAQIIEHGDFSIAFSHVEIETDNLNTMTLEDGLVFGVAFHF